ncbi:hypothetical protein [Nocardia otitidiscaviarum]|uniref:hypothetical protein n=1 Tax=Nocardia otitidiscaviarum TaxID=1823 RepID=UPI0004A74DBD|nr:hypothetical protein [Nocardia otitidiscaviarum]
MTEIVYTVETTHPYAGCELLAVCSRPEQADAAACGFWDNDPTVTLAIGRWRVDGHREHVFRGDLSDYTNDPELAPAWSLT